MVVVEQWFLVLVYKESWMHIFYAGGSFPELASQVDKLQNITMCDGEGDAPEMAGTTGLKKQEPVQLGLECKLSTGGGHGDVQIGRGNIGYPLSVISSK